MILTCPQCESQFELDSALLGEDGKRVRCSSCSHDWFQLPDPEEGAEKSVEQPVEDKPAETVEESAENPAENNAPQPDGVPEGVEPKAAGDKTLPKIDVAALLLHFKNRNNQIGYGAAFLLFLVIMIILVVFANGLSKSIPAMKGFYGAIGVHVPVAGEGLVFERVAAAHTSDGHVKIVGEVLNLKSRAVDVPQMKASMTVEDQALPIEWIIDSPADTIPSEDKVRFKTSYPYDGGNRPKSVTVRFDLLGKSAQSQEITVSAGDAGSSAAQH